MNRPARLLSGAASFAAATAGPIANAVRARAAETTLSMESRHNDDLPISQENIIPAFEESHFGIKPNIQPTEPKEYIAALNSKLDAGAANDIIACQPFAASLVTMVTMIWVKETAFEPLLQRTARP